MHKQAKIAETKFTECAGDKEWFLLNKEAENFSSGIKNKFAGYGMIITFIVIYLLIILFSIIKLVCNS
jgi:hypothetical protein